MDNPNTFSSASSSSGPAPALTQSEERTWAMLAHLASLASLASLWLLGPVVAGLIWLLYRERSRYVAHQALQSVLFQLATLFVNWAVWGVTIALMPFIVGLCLIPAAMLVTLVLTVYPLAGAYETAQGRPFRYAIIGDVVTGLQS